MLPRASQVALAVKNPPANAGDIRDMGSIPGSGSFPGEGHGNTLQYSFLENVTDWGACWAIVHRVAKRVRLDWNDLLCSCKPREGHAALYDVVCPTTVSHIVSLSSYTLGGPIIKVNPYSRAWNLETHLEMTRVSENLQTWILMLPLPF